MFLFLVPVLFSLIVSSYAADELFEPEYKMPRITLSKIVALQAILDEEGPRAPYNSPIMAVIDRPVETCLTSLSRLFIGMLRTTQEVLYLLGRIR